MRLRQAKKIMGWCKGEGNSHSKDHHKSFWRKCYKLRPGYYDERGVYVQPSCHDIDIIRRAHTSLFRWLRNKKNRTMINLHDCRFGDRLVTEEGKMVVYLGYSKIETGLFAGESHVIAGEHGDKWFYLSTYTDKGTIITNGGKLCDAGDPLNIAGIYKGDRIDLSQFKFGDRLKTRCGIPAIFLGYNEAKEYYEIAVLSDTTGKNETIFYEKDGKPNHEGLFRYSIIGKQD